MPAPDPDQIGRERALVAALEATVPRYLVSLRQAVEQAEGPDRLTMPQVRCLQAVVAAGGGALTTGLARSLRVAVPTVTRMLDGLVERGLVERRADPTNRRQVHVSPTSDGVAVLARYEGIISARLRSLVTRLDAGGQQRLLEAIEDLGATLDQEEAEQRR
jgi:DNA-binding MarR family transcriptional regulator